MTEKKLTTEEFLRIELHYSERRNLEAQRDLLNKDKEALKVKAQMALLIKQNAELELIGKTQQISEFGQTIKAFQDNYESDLKAKVKKRLDIKDNQNFSYSPDTLEVTISEAKQPEKQTDKDKGKDDGNKK